MLDSEQADMLEAASLFGLLSAGIFIVHAIEAYRVQ
jgi:hypothetical protein